MPIIDLSSPLDLAGIDATLACSKSGGVRAVYLTEWANISAVTTSGSDATATITAYTMEASTYWVKVFGDPLNFFYSGTLDSQQAFFDHLLTIFQEGNSKTQRDAILSLYGKCLVAHCLFTNGTERVVGLQINNAGDAEYAATALQPITHIDLSGQAGTSYAHIELALACKTFGDAPFATVTESTMDGLLES